MKFSRIVGSILLCMIVLTLAVPAAGIAAETIDLDRDVGLTVSYKDGMTAIDGVKFDIYKVADVNEFAHIVLTAQFSSYPVNVDGLDQKGWQELAETLNGYVKRDGLTPLTSAVTDAKGEFTAVLKPALYLILGEKKDIGDFSYTPVPFMMFLPENDIQNNTWDYDATASVKYTKESLPKIVTRKALKVWDDAGFEDKRPEYVTVELLCDGKVYDTQKLSENNRWSYTWDNLPSENEWVLVEKTPEGYYTKVSLEGITFKITNKYMPPLPEDDPPVVKRIIGDTPSSPETFTFTLRAEKSGNPMPEGSTGITKTVTVIGAGSTEFGRITFTDPGTFIYTVTEKNSGANGYTYDKTVYTITYTITRIKEKLRVDRVIADEDGNEVSYPLFTNKYTAKPTLPQTGVLWWPVPVLLSAGLMFCIIGIIRRRLNNGEKH